MPIEINRFVASGFRNARRAAEFSVDSNWLIDFMQDLRSEGLRFALETSGRENTEEFKATFREVIRPEFEYQLTRLFPGAEDEESALPHQDLARFWLLKIPGITYADTPGMIFEAAYELRERLNLRSSEPDIPIALDRGLDSSLPPTLHLTPAFDRAWSLRAMKIPEAWEYSENKGRPSRGENIIIGHPDTGYTDHIDLDVPRVLHGLGLDLVDGSSDPRDPLGYLGNPGHGLATASVAMSSGAVTPPPACGEGGTGGPGTVTGVAPSSLLLPIRVVKKVWWVFSSNLARAIHHAVGNGSHVISISLGGRAFKALKLAIEDATLKNVILVAAAGNNVRTVVWPARYSSSIALAASNIRNRPWSGTSRGRTVDASAPGEQVWRASRRTPNDPANAAGAGNGTSFATANAAGVAALWLAHFGRDALITRANGARLQEVFRSAIKQSAKTPRGWDQIEYGAGIIDALKLLETPIPCVPSNPTSFESTSIDTNLDVILDLLSGIRSSNHRELLARFLRLDDGKLEDWCLIYGPELSTILFDLIVEDDPQFAGLETNERMQEMDPADLLRRLVRNRASPTMREAMGK